MRKVTKLLTVLVVTVAAVLALSGTAQAHTRFFFGFTIAPPVVVYPAYPRVYVAPVPPPYYYDDRVYYERRYDPYTGRYYYVPRYRYYRPYHRPYWRDWDEDND